METPLDFLTSFGKLQFPYFQKHKSTHLKKKSKEKRKINCDLNPVTVFVKMNTCINKSNTTLVLIKKKNLASNAASNTQNMQHTSKYTTKKN